MKPEAADRARESRRLRAFLRRRMEERGFDVSNLVDSTLLEREEIERCLSGRHGSRMVDFFIVTSVLGVDLGELYAAVGREIPWRWTWPSSLDAKSVVESLSRLVGAPAFHYSHYPFGDFLFSLRTEAAYRRLSDRLTEIEKLLEARDGAALALLELFVQIVRCAEELGLDLTDAIWHVKKHLPWRVREAMAGGEAVEGLRFSATAKRWIEMLIGNASPTIRDQVFRALQVDRKRRTIEARLWEEVVSEVTLEDDEAFGRKDDDEPRGG